MMQRIKGATPRRLLELVAASQQQFMLGGGSTDGFEELLSGLLELTGSQCGFIAELIDESAGGPFLRVYAVSASLVSWEYQQGAGDLPVKPVEIGRLHPKVQKVLVDNEPLICNSLESGPEQSTLVPQGDTTSSLLCVPLQTGREIVGVIALFNRDAGYSEQQLTFARPVMKSGGSMIVAARERWRRIEAEDRVRGGELLRHSVVETALDCVIAMDHEGNIIEFNPAAEKTFGWSREEAMGKCLADVVIPHRMRDAHQRGMDHYLETGVGPVLGKRIEVPSIRRDGTEFPVELAITAAELDDKPVFTAYLRDITESKQVQKELEESREAAEAASRAKTAFVATVSHEIRTPINAIIGALGLLDSANISESDRQFLQTAQRSADTLLGLVNDVLDLSRIDADRLEVEIGPANPAEICDDTMQLLSDRARSNGNCIASVVQQSVPDSIDIDAGKVRQVLINLAANAVKFTKNGDIRIDVWVEDDRLSFSVSDTGVGIADADQQDLFVAFSQFGDARERGGAGLGLAISRRLVEMMGGSIRAESKLGQGSRFTFSIPFSNPVTSHDDSLQGKQALVIGDDGFLTQTVIDQCRHWQLDCRHMTLDQLSGSANIPRGDHELRILVVDSVDDFGRQVDGATLLRLAGHRQIPLALVTRSAGEASKELAAALGARLAFWSPLLQEKFRNGISDLLSGHPVQDALVPKQSLLQEERPHDIRVLLADDSQANRLVVAEMLRRAGFSVDVVADGNEAVRAVRSLPYDVVLMDIEMPNLDGMDATREIRALEGEQSTIPVIALTANVLADSRERFLGAGMNDYLSKPVDKKKLAKTVMRWALEGVGGGGRSHVPESQVAYIDDNALQNLAEDTSMELVPRMAQVFINELRDRAGRLRSGAEHKDLSRLAAEAHALKSSGATYGAVVIASHARKIDEACKEFDYETAISHADALLAAVEPSIRAMQQHPLARMQAED